MRLWVFSDLHITHSHSSLYTSFLKELEEPRNTDDHVVFAGDIFDLVVGDSSHFQKKFSVFFTRVRELSRHGVQLYYIEGNHDFHIQNLFKESKIRFENEEVILSADTASGKKMIYIAHGDLVDEEDTQYLSLRKFFRSLPLKKLTQWAPGRLVEWVGKSISRPLSQKANEIPDFWPEHERNHLRGIFRGFAAEKKRQGFDYVILGHCHDLDDVKPFYWNMGYPPVHRQYLYYDSVEDFVLRRNFSA